MAWLIQSRKFLAGAKMSSSSLGGWMAQRYALHHHRRSGAASPTLLEPVGGGGDGGSSQEDQRKGAIFDDSVSSDSASSSPGASVRSVALAALAVVAVSGLLLYQQRRAAEERQMRNARTVRQFHLAIAVSALPLAVITLVVAKRLVFGSGGAPAPETGFQHHLHHHHHMLRHAILPDILARMPPETRMFYGCLGLVVAAVLLAKCCGSSSPAADGPKATPDQIIGRTTKVLERKPFPQSKSSS